MNKRNLLVAVLGLAALGLGFAWLRPYATVEALPSTTRAGVPGQPPVAVTAMAAPAVKPPPLYEVTLSPADTDFITALRAQFKSRIHDKYAQIKLLERLMAYLMAQYPEDWSLRFYAFLQQLFPELAAQLYAQFQKLAQYNDWLRENREALMRMSPQERRAALLAARQNAFGADAAEIWAAEARTAQIQDTLAGMNAGEGVPLADKFSSYLAAINSAYGEEAGAFIGARQTELMNSFLAVDAVQQDLHGMPAAERSAALRDIRRGMGMDEAALQRWDELDRERDTAWDSGQRYMAEREHIRDEYEGEEETEQLQRLQEQNFGDEAETIRAEEESGFHRYAHQRRYGRE